METRNYIDLLELQKKIKESIASAFPGRYWIKAEIASWSPRSNGHCYVSLTQSSGGKSVAEARAMIWKWNYPQLTRFFETSTGQKLQVGLTVLVQVQVSFSELYGVSLFIENIDPAFTLGEKALERKRSIERLTSGGYMDLQKELALPDLPYRLAVITSKTAAGYQDFRNHLLNNPEGYAFHLDLFEALMQGEQAPASIMGALQEAAQKSYDAVLILRGGGSELDLACFDDYRLAVAIATSPVPVVTAIGHDKDVHIADMVAHASVKTPTALADLFLEAYETQDAILDRLAGRIGTSLQRLLAAGELRVSKADAAIRQGLQRLVAGSELRVSKADAAIRQSAQRLLAASELRVSRTDAAIRQGLQRLAAASELRVNRADAAIRQGLQRRIGSLEMVLQRNIGRISKGLLHKHTDAGRLLDQATHRVQFAAQTRISAEISKVALKEALIKASDPRNILALGYVLVTGKDNKVLKTVDKVSRGDRIGVRFSDGSLTAKVDEVYSDRKDNDKVQIA